MQGKPIWIWAAGAVLVIMIAFNVLRSPGPGGPATAGSAPVQERAPAGRLVISIANSSTKQDWLRQAVREFNTASPRDRDLQLDGKAIFVEIVQETIDGKQVDYRSGAMVADTLSGKIKPTVLSPGDESWILKFRREWQAINGRSVAPNMGPVLVRTPLVITTWQSRARALGCWPTAEPGCTWERIRALATATDGWASLGHPEWGKFKFGYGYVGESNTGTFGTVLMCMVGAGKSAGLVAADVEENSGCGSFIAGVEKAKVHSGTSSNWLLDQMIGGGPEYLDALINPEGDVVLANQTRRAELREPLVAMYPQDGTFVLGHPFTILEGVPWITPEQVAAAKVFQRFLLADERQRAVLAIGLRPSDPTARLGTPIEPSNGANPQARLASLEMPDGLVIDRIIEVWHRVKKHAVVALAFDKSGSMSGSKITAAIRGAQEFVRSMDRDDELIWRPFDGTVHPPVTGAGAEVGEDLIARIGSTPASGGTALYDAVLATYDELQGLRRTYGDTRRYGIVVLSDGRDEHSRAGLSVLESRLKPEEGDPTGIQIHTIAIGSDADEAVLKRIANAAHGRFWKGNTADQMIAVYKGIATYY